MNRIVNVLYFRTRISRTIRKMISIKEIEISDIKSGNIHKKSTLNERFELGIFGSYYL